MSRYQRQGRKGRRNAGPIDPVEALRVYAIQLHDKGDGHEVDWAKVAETCCKVAFSCMRELPPGDKGLHSVARRAHDAAYSLMTGAADSGTPYTPNPPERPAFTQGASPQNDPGLPIR